MGSRKPGSRRKSTRRSSPNRSGASRKNSLKRQRSLRKSIRILFALLLLGVALLAAALTIELRRTLPGLSELREIRHHESSRVYTSDGVLLGTWYLQNRTRVDLDEVSPLFIDALIATEDVRFYQHNGIDRRALARVLIKTLLLRKEAGGGSTLTQQLAKNLYPREPGGPWRLLASKVREMITARRLESLYDKNEILELYLNTVSFGEDTYGIETASRRFFSKDPARLELHEAATLAGLLRAPGAYNPRRYPERAVRRRNVVLRQMEKYDYISPKQAEEAISRPLSLRYERISVNEGMAPHFREFLRGELHHILENLPSMDGRSYNLYTDGLVIETTIDSRIQKAAEEAVILQMKQLQKQFEASLNGRQLLPDNDPLILQAWRQSPHYRKLSAENRPEEEIREIFHRPVPMELFTWEGEIERTASPHDSLRHYLSFLNAGLLALSPESGEVKAWVGSIHHKYFQYDHVRARRQSGSAFKPLLYAAALEGGVRPCDWRRNRLTTWTEWDEWTPRNAGDEYGGSYSIQGALVHSVNTIAVELLMETGIGPVKEMAEKAGITSPIPYEPSIALGTAEVSLLELAAAYASFAREGRRVRPWYIRSIRDAEGRLLYRFENPNMENSDQIMSPETAAAMVSMLSAAVDRGTGRGLRTGFGLTGAVAGKTGTTQSYSDGWFVGMTPDLVFGSWVGGWSPRIRFAETSGYASRTALPIAGRFLKQLESHPDLAPAAAFPPHQQNTGWNLQCADRRDDSVLDRFRDLVTGRNSEKPRKVETQREENRKERKNLLDRFRGIFR